MEVLQYKVNGENIMKLNFVKINPAENMTILILDELDRKKHIKTAQKLLAYGSLNAEQVGFVEKRYTGGKQIVRLQMMGNEFCGNATRSLAVLSVYNGYENVEKDDGKYFVDIETSGLEKVLKCEVVETEKENVYLSKVQMPNPKCITNFEVETDGNKIDVIRVDFEGISHFIVDSLQISDKKDFFDKIQCIIHNEDYEAFGIMFLDYENLYMEPLVYVKATDSLFWERSCASGTCAVGVVLSYNDKNNISLDIRQPGGILQIETIFCGGDIESIFLNGAIEIVAQGIVFL